MLRRRGLLMWKQYPPWQFSCLADTWRRVRNTTSKQRQMQRPKKVRYRIYAALIFQVYSLLKIYQDLHTTVHTHKTRNFMQSDAPHALFFALLSQISYQSPTTLFFGGGKKIMAKVRSERTQIHFAMFTHVCFLWTFVNMFGYGNFHPNEIDLFVHKVKICSDLRALENYVSV